MSDGLHYADGYPRRPRRTMPSPVLFTVIVFLLLAVLFTLAALLRLWAESGTAAAALFFATIAVVSLVTAAGLFTRRAWALYLACGLAGLLAIASLGLFGAVTFVGLGLLGWVVWALTRPAAREWLTR